MQTKNSKHLVSAIIAAYDEERYISKCIDSLKKQTYGSLEIIVVDDGSKDKTAKIAKSMGVRVFRKKHMGPGAARNYGAKYAKGEIFAFLDADMKYDKRYIKKLTRPIIEKKAIGTFHKEEYVANFRNIWAKCWAINSDLPPNRRIPDNLPDNVNIFRAIKRNMFQKIGGFDSSKGYADDATLSKKIKILALYAPGAICFHFNPDSLKEVFSSSRWIGRGPYFRKNFTNLLRFSPFNSIRVSFCKIKKGAPLSFLIFKLIYDFGVFSGLFFNFGKIKTK